MVGCIPVVGEPADLFNGLIYAAEKDYINTGISLLAMAPVAGDLGKAGKYGFKAIKALDNGGDIAKLLREAIKKGPKLSKKNYKAKRIIADSFEKYVKENADEAVEAVGKGSKKTVCKSGTDTSWYKPDGSINYPPNNGAVPGTEVNMTLKPGDALGRYGNVGEKSNFATQTGTDASKLALPPNTNPAIYREFEVIKEIPGTIQAEIAPWGGSAGGGLQYELPKPILQLIKEGYIVPK